LRGGGALFAPAAKITANRDPATTRTARRIHARLPLPIFMRKMICVEAGQHKHFKHLYEVSISRSPKIDSSLLA
jgi:hypothetical protein